MAATYSSLVGLAVGGKYEVRRVLGIGGMGVVCEAVHLDLGKKVAIKLIDKTMKESELIVARFRREAFALGQIQSEHIVDVFDVGADARVGLYMVMEHLPGEDLQSRLEREKRLDLTTGVMIGHQMARGLEKAHAAGVIHRDLKPANVFLTTRDNGSLLVKLLDFGVSKLLERRRRRAHHRQRRADRDAALHVARAGRGQGRHRRPRGHLVARRRALRGARRHAAVRRSRQLPRHDRRHPHLAPEAAPRRRAVGAVELAKVIDAMLVHDRDARIKNAAAVTKRLLEAYPTVLPDGTGRHTAVIVPTTHAVDATGDTEIFTSAGFQDAQRASRPSGAIPDDEDSKRTIPNVSSSPGVSSDATRTAAATPIEMGRDSSSSSPPQSPPCVGRVREERQAADRRPIRCRG